MLSTHPDATLEGGAIPASNEELLARYVAVRGQTDRLCEPLEPEDFVVQSMPDASPIKWHLAHTSWFFETFILASAQPDYRTIDPRYNFLFNSYYNAIGERIARVISTNPLRPSSNSPAAPPAARIAPLA